MDKLYKLHEAAKILGVSTKTLQRWDNAGKIKMVRTPTDRRRVPESEVKRFLGEKELISTKQESVLVIYGRVSSHEQKAKGDLDRQVESVRKHFDLRLFDEVSIITDVSSGLNDNRKGLTKLMELARKQEVTDIAVSYKDRLTRFDYNYLKTYFESYGVKLHIVNAKKENKTAHEELVEDLISIVTSFSGKLYGIRSKKKSEADKILKEAVENVCNLPDEE